MSGEVPERDPLADLVSRSIGTRIESVMAQELSSDDGVERKRLRFATKDGERSVIFERSPRGATLEAQLLPFLARKTAHVPVVHARGLPPPRAALGPWVLLEDALSEPGACETDPADIVRAKLAIERAVEHDEPALRALGVAPDARELPAALAAVPPRLVHGAMRCAAARRLERGTVIVGWAHAALGCPVLDVASLVLDLERRGLPADRVRDAYAADAGLEDAEALLDAAIALLRASGRR